jgi:hypothetical protein
LGPKEQKPKRVLNSKLPFEFVPIQMKVANGEPSCAVCGNAGWSIQRQSQPE